MHAHAKTGLILKTNAELVEAIRDGLRPSMEWTERDLMLLELARAQGADLDALESEPDRSLAVVRECRNQRIALGRLIGLVDVPTEASTASLHAAKAARARWKERADGAVA